MSLQLKGKKKDQVIRNVGEEAASDSNGLRCENPDSTFFLIIKNIQWMKTLQKKKRTTFFFTRKRTVL